MKRSPRPRKTTELSKSLHRQLNMYALAASAAGMGILAGAQMVEAKIIYTPADIHINLNGGRVKLDLDHDGMADVVFQATYNGSSGTGGGELILQVPFEDAMLGFVAANSGHAAMAAALPKGQRIGPGGASSRSFSTGRMAIGARTFYQTFSYGPWKSPSKRGYVGLRFDIIGKAHYAWVRVERVASKKFQYPAVITGYAYETIPNKAIIAGKTKGPDVITVSPASLGHLAVGASAIPAWRVKQTAATTH